MRELDKSRVLTVARDAVTKRGYVTYTDYNEYLRELIIKKKLQPIQGGRAQWTLKKMLVDATNPVEDRYVYSRAGAKVLFYPAAIMDNNPFLKPQTKQGKLE